MTEDLVEHQCDVRGSLLLSSFFGGVKNGRCVQLTTPSDYVQMTFDDAKAFFKEAIKTIEAIEKQYNENPPWWEQIAKK